MSLLEHLDRIGHKVQLLIKARSDIDFNAVTRTVRMRKVLVTSAVVVTMLIVLATWTSGPQKVSTYDSVMESVTRDGLKGQWTNTNASPVLDPFDTELFEIEGPFDGSALRKHCETIDWRQGLYFDCSTNSGGIGNMRSFILTCVRHAIDGGAGLVMPTIRKRDDANLANLFTNVDMPLGYMFDEKFFLDSIAEYCPQLVIVKDRKAIPHADKQFFKPDVNPKAMGNHLDNDHHGFDANNWAGTFREDLDWWMANTWGHTPAIEAPVVLTFSWPFFFTWPIWLDGPRFSNTFGRLLKIRPDVMILASKALKGLQMMDPEATKPLADYPTLMSYMGVHLRVESDRLGWWPDEDRQVNEYIQRATDLGLRPSIIYVATGSQTGYDHFSRNASAELGARTVYKEALLEGDDLAELKALKWDQQALVDYLILLRSRYFAGIMQSSFAQNLAIRRRLLLDGIETTIWRGYYDQWSYLAGPRRRYNDDWLFFSHETMWP